MASKKPVPVERVFNPATNQYSSIYAPPVGFCGCVECTGQFRRREQQFMDRMCYSDGLSTQEASDITLAYAKSIDTDRTYLMDKVNTHGNTIIKRWKKKSRDKRSATLLAAFPNIFPEKWNAAVVNYDYANVTWRKVLEYREALLAPWLNLPELRDDPLKLLALVHFRTQFAPEAWVAFDKVRSRSTWGLGGFRTEYAETCVILHGPKYGKATRWDTALAHQWDIVGFPRARLILETQAMIMTFLRNSVSDILDGVTTEGSPDKWTLLVNSGFRKSIGSETWSQFSDPAFSSPVFDAERLLLIAKARLEEAEDNMWLIQTDPAYFQSCIKQASQGLIFKESNSEQWQGKIASEAWQGPLYELISWKWVVVEIENVRAKWLESKGEITTGKPLPVSFSLALGALELLLINLLQRRRRAVGHKLPQLKGFEELYKRDYSQAGRVTMMYNTAKGGDTRHQFRNDPLHWCLCQLAADPESETMFDPTMLFRVLDDWMENDTTTAADRARLDPKLLDDLSNLASTHELLAAIRQFKPLHTPISIEEAQKHGLDRPAWRGFGEKKDEAYAAQKSDFEILGKTMTVFLETPFPKGKRDSKWLEQASQVRQNSKEFWDNAKEIRAREMQGSKLRSAEDKKWEVSILSFITAPEHVKFLENERDTILSKKVKVDEPKSSVPDSWTLMSTLHEPVALTSRPKDKVKRRPEQAEEAKAVEPATDFDTTISQSPFVQLKPESIQVLTRLFPASIEEYSAKPLDWRTFLTAMEDAGFMAINSGGSAVIFTKEKEGRIVFHRPHPVAKIEQVILQAMGRRMSKWFGWHRNIFVPVTKATSLVQ